jgi:tRNA/tmRNA/rRNA uracil-C5-methylase (TrmA/RlmC/RlmD family)
MAGAVTYDREYPVKSGALREFLASTIPDLPADALVPSVQGRDYRFVSKRKMFRQGKILRLGLIDPDDRTTGGSITVGRCAIEPPGHALVYQVAGAILASADAAALASVLRYVIVKGDEKEQMVLLSVGGMDPEVVKSAGRFSKQLSRRAPEVTSVLLYEDTTAGRYYLGLERGRTPRLRKIFGRDALLIRVHGRPFLFGPLSFSQVNRRMIEPLVDGARALLALDSRQTLFDLYCGYGLFALSLGREARAVIGVEAGRDAVEAARANARRQGVNARFYQSEIAGATIGRVMREAAAGDAVLLDPPRGGTSPGVIEGIAAKAPARVVHIVCNIDGLAAELGRWRACGYAPRRAVPFDLFPGTASVEVMILLTPAA